MPHYQRQGKISLGKQFLNDIQARKKMEIQKELKALTKELRPKKKKERMVEAEEDNKKEEEVETKEKNDVLESYHKEKKRYAEAKASKPIPKQKVSHVDNPLFSMFIT